MSYVYGTRVSREHIKLNEHTCERTEKVIDVTDQNAWGHNMQWKKEWIKSRQLTRYLMKL